jgi:hypothetical protein
MEVVIEIDGQIWNAELYETTTARLIYNSMPFEGTVNTWGEEIYFDIGMELELEDEAKAEVEVGDITYWPMGKAFCIFFGQTPASKDQEPVAFSPVNVFGQVKDDTESLKKIQEGAKIKVRATE